MISTGNSAVAAPAVQLQSRAHRADLGRGEEPGSMPGVFATESLGLLRQARLVEAEKRGVFVTHRVAGAGVADFFRSLRGLAESRLAEVQQIARAFVEKRSSLEAVDRRRLLERVRAGEVTLLDVRPPEEYRAAHLAGAVSLPLKELESRLAEVPKDREIVAYCRGPYCVPAPEAVELLRSRGHRAAALSDGVAEWRAQGLPVASGEASRAAWRWWGRSRSALPSATARSAERSA